MLIKICPSCRVSFDIRTARLSERVPVTYEPARIPDKESMDYDGDDVLYFHGGSYKTYFDGAEQSRIECPHCYDDEIPIPDGMRLVVI